jgi:hypothetical protein
MMFALWIAGARPNVDLRSIREAPMLARRPVTPPVLQR